MKKIIIILMGISMMLVSCSTPTTPTIDTPTVSTNGTENGSDNGNNGGTTSTPSNPTTPTSTTPTNGDSTNGTENGSDNGNNGGNTSTPSTQYTVTFDSNGGSSITSQTVSPNGHATRPANPTKADCEFAYWYEGSNTNTPFDFDSAINGNITLNAKWYMHYFELEDGETVNSFTYKVKYDSNYSTSTNQINVLGSSGLGIGDVAYHCDYSTNGNKITFTYHKYPNTPNVKVHNVTVDRTTSPKFTVTIELVDNN